jgi:hypothetical protein
MTGHGNVVLMTLTAIILKIIYSLEVFFILTIIMV